MPSWSKKFREESIESWVEMTMHSLPALLNSP